MNPRSLKISALIASILALSATGAFADPVTYNFNQSPGSNVSNVYASDGLTLATETSGGSYGEADIGGSGFDSDLGVSNSTTGEYPTTEYLDFNFAAPVEVDSFTFDNYGNNSGFFATGSTYSAYNSDGGYLGGGNISNDQGGSVTVDLSDVALLQFSNGESDSSWEFVVPDVTVTASAVPDGGMSAILLGAGLISLFALRRRSARA